jgi:FtsP/CotA-like multicopper oxidase with cupredoxin domain
MGGSHAIITAATFMLLVARSTQAELCPLSTAGRPRVVANDNVAAGGTVRNGVVMLRLVMQDANWYPDGPNGCALQVRTFAEEGKPPRIPGPLIRVSAGTEVQVTVRNRLASTLWVRGLQDRASGVLDSTEVAPGVTRQFRFRAVTPGAWYYWAGGANARVPASDESGQLAGALVVDSLPAVGARPAPRIFLMTRWTPAGTRGNRGFQVNAINGLSWPHTERLTYPAGDSIRWHVINASDELHMMHLHGFYFRVEARGDATHDSVLARVRPVTVVTTATRAGEWVSIVWWPDRPGNWLFHCHLTAHMSARQQVGRMPAPGKTNDSASYARVAATSKTANHATESMAGLLLGVTVRPVRTDAEHRTGNADPAVVGRVVHVYADTRPHVFGAAPGFGFVVQTGAQPPAADSVLVVGAPLVLTRGEPVRITVHNRLVTPLAVHWHGIELESYFDGVGGWSGMGRRIAPMIAPNDSFVARFTPPRAGTFMYHVHSEDGDELSSGLYAPLLVLEPGQRFDPQTDRVFIIGTAGPAAGRGDMDAPAFINGKATPDTVALVVGTTYRLRVIDISANDAHTLSLRGPAGPVTWRVLARDGRDLPADQTTPGLARENTAAGVTRDFEFTPATVGDYTLTATTIAKGTLTSLVTTMPIRVRAP